MEELYRKYLKINEEIKSLTVEKENLKADIKLALEVLETDRFEDDAVVVSLKESVRNSYPVAKLKEMLSKEQVESVKTETTVSTLRVDLK